MIPIGNTAETIRKNEILEADKRKAEKYKEMKILLDNLYKQFLEKSLEEYGSNIKIYEPKLYADLAEALKAFQNDKNEENRNNLRKMQENCRKNILNHMKTSKNFPILTGKETKKILDLMFSTVEDPSVEELKKEFKGFNGYFNGYCENRRNMFSDRELSVAVPYRAVNDNFSKYFNNIQSFMKIQKTYPELYSSLQRDMSRLINDEKLEDYFDIASYPGFITQKGIEKYNRMLGGESREDAKIQGFNEIINLYCQQHPQMKRGELLMVPLFKQILSDTIGTSFIPQPYENEAEMVSDIYTIISSEFADSFSALGERLSDALSFDRTGIYISNSQFRSISQYCLGEWDALALAHRELLIQNILSDKKKLTKKDEKLVEKTLKETWLDLSTELKIAAFHGEQTLKMLDSFFSEEIPRMFRQLGEKREQLKKLLIHAESSEPVWFRGNEKNLEILKDYMDSLLNCAHVIKGFIPSSDYEMDLSFYNDLLDQSISFRELTRLYDKIRNFMTQKNTAEKKFKVNFESSTLGNGWDENKQVDNLCLIFKDSSTYYLAVMNKNCKTDFLSDRFSPTSGEDIYQRMVYKYIPSTARQFPKVFFPKSGKYKVKPPEDLISCKKKERDRKENFYSPEFSSQREYEIAMIRFYQEAIPEYGDWAIFDMKFKAPEEYENIKEFYSDADRQSFFMTFRPVSKASIDKLVSEEKLYMFKIYNKDFAQGATGKDNLHTLYWKALFSDENIGTYHIKLNGQAELFFRPMMKQKNEGPTHPVGSYVVNRTLENGDTLSENIHFEIYEYANKRRPFEDLSEEAKRVLPSAVIKKVTHSLTKGKRFYEDQFFFHVSLTFNPYAQKNDFNQRVAQMLVSEKDVNLIGIDRGERNLLYISVIDQNGKILHQESLNSIERPHKKGFVDYQAKLRNAEIERDRARKSWKTIGKIKDLKEGYLSQIISKITGLMIKYNAIIVMEDLNFGFKRGRFKVERQVYQKFEAALINKLNLLAFKDYPLRNPGGILKPLQLAPPFESFQKLYKQTGWIFYVPAAYTSKIDPTTGFVNLFRLKNLTNFEKKKDFFLRFDSIRYDHAEDVFKFTFDYSNFDCAVAQKKGSVWEISSNGTRIVYNKKSRSPERINPTEILKQYFEEVGISFREGLNLLPQIEKLEMNRNIDSLYRSFTAILQMRNSDPKTGEDYILSPVKNRDGYYFDSRNVPADAILPSDADANGAYNIARKGLLYIHQLREKGEKASLKISHDDWLRYAKS